MTSLNFEISRYSPLTIHQFEMNSKQRNQIELWPMDELPFIWWHQMMVRHYLILSFNYFIAYGLSCFIYFVSFFLSVEIYHDYAC